jgi:hypothetical protein
VSERSIIVINLSVGCYCSNVYEIVSFMSVSYCRYSCTLANRYSRFCCLSCAQVFWYRFWMQFKSSLQISLVLNFINILHFLNVNDVLSLKFQLLYVVILTRKATVPQVKNGYRCLIYIIYFYIFLCIYQSVSNWRLVSYFELVTLEC